MTIRRALAASATTAILATGCGSPNALAPFPAGLDDAVTAAMAAAKIPGALLGVWSPEGAYVKAFGVADIATGRPMATDFYSRIGSVTKTFTATAVLQLVKAGRVRLDDPIGTYLDGVPGGQSITVRQLASMRSGLPDYLDTDGFEAAMAADPKRQFGPAELLGWAFTEPASFPPGAKFQYCNTNYILLGQLVEKVSGQRLGDYLSAHIFGPLHLDHTSFPAGAQFPDPHATGYTAAVQGSGPPIDASGWNTSFAGAAGAAVSTLADTHTWLPALATGTLLTPELQQQRLHTDPEPGRPADFGYGLGVFTVAGWVGHNGSVPGYQTVAMYLPERKISLVVMINTDIAAPGGGDPSEAVAKAVTKLVSPDHIYAL